MAFSINPRRYYDGDFPHPVGGISPIPATSAMTLPVGVRDGQLFTTPTGGAPVVTEEDNGKLLEVVNGAWAANKTIPNRLLSAEENILDLLSRVNLLENRMDALYIDMGDILGLAQDIERGDV